MTRRAASESMRAEVFQNLVQPGGVEGFSVCGGVFREEQAGGLGNGGAGVGKIGAGVYADLLYPLVCGNDHVLRNALHAGVSGGDGAERAADDPGLGARGQNIGDKLCVSGCEALLVGLRKAVHAQGNDQDRGLGHHGSVGGADLGAVGGVFDEAGTQLTGGDIPRGAAPDLARGGAGGQQAVVPQADEGAVAEKSEAVDIALASVGAFGQGVQRPAAGQGLSGAAPAGRIRPAAVLFGLGGAAAQGQDPVLLFPAIAGKSGDNKGDQQRQKAQGNGRGPCDIFKHR